MSKIAGRIKVKTDAQGHIRMPEITFAPGIELELIILEESAVKPAHDSPAGLTALVSQEVLAALWDTEEEELAWQGL